MSPRELDRQFARTPTRSASSPRARPSPWSPSTSCSAITPPTEYPELQAIAQLLADWAQQEFGWDHHLIALGASNIGRVGDPLFEAFTSTCLAPAPQLAGLPHTFFDDPGAGHFYDQLAWFTKGRRHRPVLIFEAGAGGQTLNLPLRAGQRGSIAASAAALIRAPNAAASLRAATSARPTRSLPRPWPSRTLKIRTRVLPPSRACRS